MALSQKNISVPLFIDQFKRRFKHFGLLGTDNPVYIYTIGAKNFSDYHVQHEKEIEIVGDEVGKFWNKILGCLRNFETKTCWYCPDLSCIPKEK